MQLIPLSKQSKKFQKVYHNQQRASWNGVNPVTRIVPNKKHYARKPKNSRQNPALDSFC